MSSMKAAKILIVEVNCLGDVLFSTPAIKALRKKFPGDLEEAAELLASKLIYM